MVPAFELVMEKLFCVISHTHWDREWYLPLEKFRLKLVDLIDNLLNILEMYPEYIFHLDAQSIVLEDYLEIRPQKRDILMKYIKEGRILVGPWYVQNDFYLTSGEATVRNLLIGSRIAEEFGRCTWVGYTPDQFGLISQLPQIFNGFGIDSCIFGRGYNFFKKSGEELESVPRPSELIWKSGDGSKVLGVHMPFWYNNAQRFSEDVEKSLKLLKLIEKQFDGIALTPYLLLMNGVDHLEAQENLVSILDKIRAELPETKQIRQFTMPEYIVKVKEYLEQSGKMESIPVSSSEMRYGTDFQILQGTLSSRIYLKAANVKAQNLLENNLEPLYSFILMSGAKSKYPHDFLNYLWKLLIQNHPHDSICGCSCDDVHNHMEDRYCRIGEVGEELLQRGMDFITAHVSREGLDKGDYLISVFNTLECSRSAVVELELHFPVEESVEAFHIIDPEGNEIPYIILSRERKYRNLSSTVNLPGFLEIEAYRIQMYIEHLDGMSYKVFNVEIVSEIPEQIEMVYGSNTPTMKMENEHLSVVINENGNVDLLYRETGKLYKNILQLEDAEDSGDSYVYKGAGCSRYTTDELIPDIQCICNTEFETRYGIIYHMILPENFDKSTGIRSDKLLENRVEVVLGLKKDGRWLEVGFNIDNTSKDHRLRALIYTGMETNHTYASTPFDVITRDRQNVMESIKSGTQPNSGFIDIVDRIEGLAILNEGMYEYEHLMDQEGTIAVTLIRANGKIEANSKGDTWEVPGNQCLRRISLNMALYPHKGNWADAVVATKAREFQTPVLSYYQPVDVKKFLGGRPAVQDSNIKEIFYREDPFAGIVLPRSMHFLDVNGRGVTLSALKQAENGDMLVVRVYNTTREENTFELSCFKRITRAYRLDLNEKIKHEISLGVSENVTIILRPKEIFTLGLKME